MKDLQINMEDTESGVKNDLIVDKFDLSLVDKIDQIRHKLQIRLQFFYGEWYLDTTQGVKYFDEIFKKNPTLARVQSILKSVITDTPGVTELLNISCNLDKTKRQLSVAFTVSTTLGVNITMSTGVNLP